MYNKIFTKILDSSIWMEALPTRVVWLTFIAAMDENGMVVFASPANVAHRAIVPLDDTIKALATLEGPDPNSSDSDNEGRRIEKVPGGWHVLNAHKYRELVTRAIANKKSHERVRDFRERKKSGVNDRIAAQGSRCKCCGEQFAEPFRLYVVQDHCHETGDARDLICQSCNHLVGRLESGRPVKSDKLDCCLAYLIRHGNAPVTGGNENVTPSGSISETGSGSGSEKIKKNTNARAPDPDPDPDDIGTPPAIQPPAGTDADAWRFGVSSEPWARSLIKIAKIGPKNWTAWKALVDAHDLPAVESATRSIPASERWPDAVTESLAKSRGQANPADVIAHRIHRMIL